MYCSNGLIDHKWEQSLNTLWFLTFFLAWFHVTIRRWHPCLGTSFDHEGNFTGILFLLLIVVLYWDSVRQIMQVNAANWKKRWFCSGKIGIPEFHVQTPQLWPSDHRWLLPKAMNLDVALRQNLIKTKPGALFTKGVILTVIFSMT